MIRRLVPFWKQEIRNFIPNIWWPGKPRSWGTALSGRKRVKRSRPEVGNLRVAVWFCHVHPCCCGYLSGGWETGLSPSTSRRVQRCSSQRPIGTSRSPDLYSWSGSQSWGWLLIHGWPGRLISISLVSKVPRGGECWILSWTEGVAPPSGTESCSIGSSFFHGGLRVLHLEVRCSHPCEEAAGALIQASSPCYRCTFVHWEFHSDHIGALTGSFDSKLTGVGKPLVRKRGRYLRWPRVDPGRLKRKLRGAEVSTPVLPAHKTVIKLTKRIVPNIIQAGIFRLPWLKFFCGFSQF
jgi:hypothetical protein